MVHVTLNDL